MQLTWTFNAESCCQNNEKILTFRKNDYDISFLVRLNPISIQNAQKALVSQKSNINAHGIDIDVEIIEITNLLQPYRDDEENEKVDLKSMKTSNFKDRTASVKKLKTKKKVVMA